MTRLIVFCHTLGGGCLFMLQSLCCRVLWESCCIKQHSVTGSMAHCLQYTVNQVFSSVSSTCRLLGYVYNVVDNRVSPVLQLYNSIALNLIDSFAHPFMDTLYMHCLSVCVYPFNSYLFNIFVLLLKSKCWGKDIQESNQGPGN